MSENFQLTSTFRYARKTDAWQGTPVCVWSLQLYRIETGYDLVCLTACIGNVAEDDVAESRSEDKRLS